MAAGNLGEVLLDQGRLVEADGVIRESLALRFALRDRFGSPEQLQSLARVAAVQGYIERATRLWAAGNRVRRDLGANVVPAFREEHQRFVQSLQQRLGPEPFARAWEAGQGRTLEQAVAEALQLRSIAKSQTPVETLKRCRDGTAVVA